VRASYCNSKEREKKKKKKRLVSCINAILNWSPGRKKEGPFRNRSYKEERGCIFYGPSFAMINVITQGVLKERLN
jgi:hypothetical protein